MKDLERIVYRVSPRRSGLQTETVIGTEDGTELFYLRSKLFSPLGRTYTLYDPDMQELLTTRQEDTAIFSRHTLLQDGRSVGEVGQLAVIPLKYFVQLRNLARTEVHIGVFSSIYQLKSMDGDTVTAEFAQHRSDWFIDVATSHERLLALAAVVVICREITLGH